MFEVLFRITDKKEDFTGLSENDFVAGVDVEGFFAINVNGNYYGHYHDSPLRDNESGWTLITEWFIHLISAYLSIVNSSYVAVSDIESYKTWIEFKKERDFVFISIIDAKKPVGSTALEHKPFSVFSYGDWHKEPTTLTEICSELKIKTRMYLNEIRKIEEKLFHSKRISYLESIASSL